MARKRSQSKPRARAAPNGGDLCLRCGLCCDGTVFSAITLEPGEEPFVESLGLSVVDDAAGKPVAAQPCPAFLDGCCSLYARGRPQTCHTYTCGLLSRYTAGTARLDDCLGTIRLVRSVAHELEDEMGLPLGSYNRRVLSEYLAEHQPQERPDEHAALLVAFHRLLALGVKYFGYAPRPAEQAAADAGAAVTAESAPD
jgi:uncharacterized protein